MGIFAEYRNEVGRVMQELNYLKTRMQQLILALPDNPDIVRIGAKRGAFTIRISNLDRGWSPSMYDFKSQYEEIVNAMEAAKSPELLIALLENLMERGSIGKRNFHPRVVENIKTLLQEVRS
jgi:hypothetical protein